MRRRVPNNSIHYSNFFKKCHLIATHSMAVKDSNFLIFFSCHVIQTLICLHISYLGVKRRMSKIAIFRRQWGPYQTTPAPVLSAIHQRLCEWNVTYRNCTTKRDHTVRASNSQVTEPRLFLCFLSGIFPSWGTLFTQRLSYHRMDTTESPAPNLQKS